MKKEGDFNMKTFKKILLLTIGILVTFVTVSCTENSVLDDLLATTLNLESTAEVYAGDNLTEADGIETELSSSVQEYSVTLLTETLDNPLITFSELRLELIGLHQELLVTREEIHTYAESIRNSIQALKAMNYVLLDEDRDFFLSQIEELKLMRSDLLATKGEAYARIYDLRGTYTRENLPYIISVYEEVKVVLEFRLETLQNSLPIFAGIDNILKEYLGI